MEISFSCNSTAGDHTKKKFCVWHDYTAVVPYAKFCSDDFIRIWMRAEWNFHYIWIVMEKLLVKWSTSPIIVSTRKQYSRPCHDWNATLGYTIRNHHATPFGRSSLGTCKCVKFNNVEAGPWYFVENIFYAQNILNFFWRKVNITLHFKILFNIASGMVIKVSNRIRRKRSTKRKQKPGVRLNTTMPSSHMMTSSNGNIFRVTGPLCGEFTGPGEFPTQRPVTQSFDVFFDLRLNKRLSKQPWGWWFETPSCSLWRRCNASIGIALRLQWSGLDRERIWFNARLNVSTWDISKHRLADVKNSSIANWPENDMATKLKYNWTQ